MAHLFLQENNPVHYLCWCGVPSFLYQLYFCRHCSKLRCSNCVTQEIISHYCPNCSEFMPPVEASLKKGRCPYCYDCPICFHTLSTHVQKPSDVTSEKVYFLYCNCCRWTSRDSEIPDKTNPRESWGELGNPHAGRISDLLEHYKSTAMAEKLERKMQGKEMSEAPKGKGKKGGCASTRSSLLREKYLDKLRTWNSPHPAEATEEAPEPLPDKIFDSPVDLTSVTSLSQRLQLESQSESTSAMFPTRKRLLTNLAKRCPTCEHTLFKPELNPSSIKPRIYLGAKYHVPEVRVIRLEPTAAEEGGDDKLLVIVLKIINPNVFSTLVAILPWMEGGAEGGDIYCMSSQEAYTKDPSAQNGRMLVPSEHVLLEPKVDADENDDRDDTRAFDEDPEMLIWKKRNKAHVRVTIVSDSTEKKGAEMVAGLLMHYDYINTLATRKHGEDTKLKMETRLYLHLKHP